VFDVESERRGKRMNLELLGPYEWRTLSSHLESEKVGVYLWTIPFGGKYLVYYVGETGVSFANRFREHEDRYLNKKYRIYDTAEFVKGNRSKETILWYGEFESSLITEEERSTLSKDAYDMMNTFHIFLLPIKTDKRIRERIEVAIFDTLREQSGIVGEFIYKQVKYNHRRPEEEPIKVSIKSSEQIMGLPKELWA
jgi:hypothetical protein